MTEPTRVAGAPSVVSGSLVLADLSGYTHYLQSVELDTVHVVTHLLDVVAAGLAPLSVVHAEGDAIFCHDEGDKVRGRDLLAVLDRCYESFVDHSSFVVTQSGCGCRACAGLNTLDLKFVVHHGTYAMHRLADRVQPVGPSVIVAHRLLKNSVAARTGLRAYVLVTEQWVTAAGGDDLEGFQPLVEEYSDIGDVACRVSPLRNAGVTASPTPEASQNYCSYEPQRLTIGHRRP